MKRNHNVLTLEGTLSAMDKAINTGRHGLAVEIGEAYIHQRTAAEVIDNPLFWFRLSLAFRLCGERYADQAEEARKDAERCSDLTPEMSEALDRDELLALIRSRRIGQRAWELYNQEWPQHQQDANHRALLLSIRARFMYSLGQMEEALTLATQASELWDVTGQQNPQWRTNHNIHFFKTLVRYGCAADGELQEFAQSIRDDPRCILSHRVTVWLVLRLGRFGNWLDDMLRLAQARYAR